MDDLSNLTNETEFRPELLPRRGEFVAWGLSAILIAALVLLRIMNLSIFWGLPLVGIFLILFAMAISLSNFVDRRTVMRVSQEGISFENGLRKSHLKWEEIDRVQVYPSGWGDKVYVLGPGESFNFRTMGEVWHRGEIRGRMGFAEGDKILTHILAICNLKQIEHPGSGKHYARE